MDNENNFEIIWYNYISVLQQLVVVRKRRPPKTFLSSFNTLFEEIFQKLNEESVVKEITMSWHRFKEDNSNKITANLIKSEMVSFVNGFLKVTGSATDIKFSPPPKNKWLSPKITAKEMLKAGKTILDSIIDVIGEVLPKWIRDLLKILKEVLEIAGG